MISFVVPGTPVGKGRPKFARRGNFTVAYTPEKTASYENLVKIAAHEAMSGNKMIEGAAAARIFLFVTPPASWSMKKKACALNDEIFPTAKPDLDNCVKIIFDAMNQIVFNDDKQVVSLQVQKRFSETASVHVHVWEMKE